MTDEVITYGPELTATLERTLVTVIGNAGFWGRHLYLVGGLAPRYLATRDIGSHVGSHDIDLALVLALDTDETVDYETLSANLKQLNFEQAPRGDDPAFRWRRDVDGRSVILEFLCDTDEVQPGRNWKPRSGAGATFQALNAPGVRLVREDYKVATIEAERLDGGGISKVEIRVAGLLPFVVLKSFALRQRHKPKDAFDIVWTLDHHEGGAAGAGHTMAASPIRADPLVPEALAILRESFASADHDGAVSYAVIGEPNGTPEVVDEARNRAVAVVARALGRTEM